MSHPSLTPLQEILRAIERVAPRAWHYRDECRREGFEVEGVEQVLEMLHLEGLVTRGPSDPDSGPGVVLTPKGARVARDPEMFDRLGTGEAIEANDPGAIVRQSLRQSSSPLMTRFIILLNFLVFAWCIYLANNAGVLGMYLRGPLLGEKVGKEDRLAQQRVLDAMQQVETVFHRAGGLTAVDLVHGEWWRLLTCCFVQGGILHILMNMYALNGGGQFVEQTWGRWRFALIYLLSCWGGSCLAMAMQPMSVVGASRSVSGVVGASGAVCGVFATIGVWFFLNGKYIPRGMAQRGRSQILTNVVLMVFISLIPGVSGYGHLGGALAGGIAAVVLNFARFGSPLLRLLAWPILLALPIGSYLHLEHARKTSELWHDVEFHAFSKDWVSTIQKTMKPAIADYTKTVKEVREIHPERRDEADVHTAVATLDEHIGRLEALTDQLQKSGPYHGAEVVEIRDEVLSYIRQRAEVFREAKRCLEVGKDWKGSDEKKFDERWQEMRRLRAKWEERLK